jgi:isoleucyl-tRNA synthetase
MSPAEVLELERSGTFTAPVGGSPVTVTLEDVTIAAQSIEGWLVDSEEGLTVALDTSLTPALIDEGLAREFVNRVQNMRKDAGFSVTDRIRIQFRAPDKISSAIQKTSDYIQSEVLATQLQPGNNGLGDHTASWEIDGEACQIGISRV